MQVFVAALIITFAGVTQAYSIEERVERHHNTCFLRSGVSLDLLEAFRRGEFIEDERLRVYSRCMFEQHGYVNPYGELQVETIKNDIPEEVDYEQAVRVIENCRETIEETQGGFAYEMNMTRGCMGSDTYYGPGSSGKQEKRTFN